MPQMSPTSLKKRKISIHDTELETEKMIADPKSWKFYYKLEKERKAKLESQAGFPKSGTKTVPQLSPLKSIPVAATGLQSIN